MLVKFFFFFFSNGKLNLPGGGVSIALFLDSRFSALFQYHTYNLLQQENMNRPEMATPYVSLSYTFTAQQAQKKN